MCFTFVCGHVGIYGKEQADYLAKNATKKNINADANVPKSYLKNIFNLKQLKNGIISILLQVKKNITKKFFPTISEIHKNKHLVLNFDSTQFLSGHGNFSDYLECFKLAFSGPCSCVNMYVIQCQ